MKALKWILKTIGWTVAMMVLLIAGAATTLRIQHDMSLKLPPPTGPFAVGRTSFYWVDETRTDMLTPTPGTRRELMVWVWYPASKNGASGTNTYVSNDYRKAIEQHQGPILSGWVKRDLELVQPASLKDAPVAEEQASYPVVLMKSGIGASSTDYTTLAEDLASHGYIVVGNDSPYSTVVTVFPDGRKVERNAAGNPGESASLSAWEQAIGPLLRTWTADTGFELDQLKRINETPGRFLGKLNLQQVGIFGHSFGGATSAEFCYEDVRCKAGVDVDGQPFGEVVQSGVAKPFLLLLSDHSKETDSESKAIMARLHSLYDHSSPDRLWVTFRGTGHFSFSDEALIVNWPLGRLSGSTGRVGGRRGLEMERAYLHNFFDAYLKGKPAALLQQLPGRFPEVIVEH